LAKANFNILNLSQPVARRHEQIVHKLINSAACEANFLLKSSEIGEEHETLLDTRHQLETIELKDV
jgi:hypothetical protein